MGIIQGCASRLETPATIGEQLRIMTPPDADGIWRSGIMVR